MAGAGKKKIKPFKNRRVGVLVGGTSSERAISLKSGRAVLKALASRGYKTVKIDAKGNIAGKIKSARIDVAFIALHGKGGEDGTVQGLLELMGIPYTGSGVLASAVAMDKVMTKELLKYNKIPTPAFEVVEDDKDGTGGLKLPVVVKPVSEGSTIGITVVKKKSELASAVKKATRGGTRALIERYIKGVELTVGVVEGQTLPPVEIMPKNGFYDYKSKYTKGMVDFQVPANISEALRKRVEKLALDSYLAIGCRGGARVDLMVDEKKKPYVIEINTIPGLTEMSLLPMASAYAGVGYESLVEGLLNNARLG